MRVRVCACVVCVWERSCAAPCLTSSSIKILKVLKSAFSSCRMPTVCRLKPGGKEDLTLYRVCWFAAKLADMVNVYVSYIPHRGSPGVPFMNSIHGAVLTSFFKRTFRSCTEHSTFTPLPHLRQSLTSLGGAWLMLVGGGAMVLEWEAVFFANSGTWAPLTLSTTSPACLHVTAAGDHYYSRTYSYLEKNESRNSLDAELERHFRNIFSNNLCREVMKESEIKECCTRRR